MKQSIYLSVLILLGTAFTLFGQKGHPAKVPTTVSVSTFYPQHEDYRPSLMARLKVPAGFKVEAIASGLGKPRMMALTDKGGLYVTRRDVGDVILLQDKDGDGKMESLTTVWANFLGVHGIAIQDGYLYLANSTDLRRGKINNDGTLTDTMTLVKDLPEGAQHDNRVLNFGPDGMLYISVGSSCNDCGETNKEHATILRFSKDFSSRKIFARGLRNTIGFDWNPMTREMWGCDNGTDWRSDEFPPEELNRIIEDQDYGWPRVFAKQQVDQTREDPIGATKEAYAKTTVPSVMEFPAHSAPIDFRFLGSAKDLPKDYQDDALVCWHGSWNRSRPEGYKVQRIKFENGQPIGMEDFFSGFLSPDGKTRFGRPAGLAVSAKGTIYISDDESGVIYAVSKIN
ncbi:MAG: PQQ-dependent sugar dehydrogenase [Pedobacter sp.]|nr:PQQ-dependent sugar dehydrogenase [Pedobacter sp.]MDQ8053850.1 PQQ-dependent sugar dehydrogenase [Pedobacter sp.]